MSDLEAEELSDGIFATPIMVNSGPQMMVTCAGHMRPRVYAPEKVRRAIEELQNKNLRKVAELRSRIFVFVIWCEPDIQVIKIVDGSLIQFFVCQEGRTLFGPLAEWEALAAAERLAHGYTP